MTGTSYTLALLIDGDNASPKIVRGFLAEIATYGGVVAWRQINATILYGRSVQYHSKNIAN